MIQFVLIFFLLIAILLVGLPVAFGLGSTAVVLALLQEHISINFLSITVLESLNSFTLLAVPLFVLMSQVLLTGKVGDNLFDTINAWVRHLPGGLGVATVFPARSLPPSPVRARPRPPPSAWWRIRP